MSGFRGTRNSKPKGSFTSNTWHCDCAPPLPADHFKVRKEGKNKGRWFYTCQKQQEERCGFFLWEEEAKPRMDAAIVAASPNEPHSSRYVAASNHDPNQSGLPGPAYPPGSVNPGKRRLQTEVDGDWPTDADLEAELSKVDDYGNTSMVPPPPVPSVTPRKAIKTDACSTPSSKALMTPVSRHTHGRMTDAEPSAESPTPSRYKNTPTSGRGEERSAVREVMRLLSERNIDIDSSSRDGLHEVLREIDLRVEGISRGRDISRLAVKERNAKISELQARILSLEAELETQRAVISNLNWQKETGQFD
ncbi:uncharacterized protein K452DRAFT_218170 [Aplosporella prunicola CBS 121167]|uniref:GRF-type domain-containing protein n=1 Tax=Aplosporella prunicola CBS 121167 TaxID=1176127 RepID=A0A6A6BS70_9PEZI|nr:uncharacterized protein K452DRAFT_218170 [Aplosporella prunicola CBS 121167]KAF2146638.1 hypothetical protein K452DRAFT_218170 [Aplosporella prunicola CBS 121167]